MSKKSFTTDRDLWHKDAVAQEIKQQAPHNRSREPITRSRETVRGCFPSLKMGRMVDWESQLEQRACYRFEFSKSVLEYREQPEPIWLPFHQKYRKYTPDFELKLSDGQTIFVEVKPFDHLKRDDIAKKLTLASLEYQERGYGFIVITDLELINPVMDSTFKLLRQYLRFPLESHLILQAQQELTDQPLSTVGSLAKVIGKIGPVYALIAQQILISNLDSPLNIHSKLKYFGDTCDEHFIFLYRTAPDFRII